MKMAIRLIARCWDRSMTCSKKKRNKEYAEFMANGGKKDDEEDAEIEEFNPNTKKIRQTDLQNLYTGPQIEAGEKFA